MPKPVNPTRSAKAAFTWQKSDDMKAFKTIAEAKKHLADLAKKREAK